MTDRDPAASRIAALLAIDPSGLGGVWLRARHGPRRDALAAPLEMLPGRHERIMPEGGDTEIFGGIDLSQSLFSGKIVETEGLLARSDVVWLTRAERMPVRLAARIASVLDETAHGPLILSDESAEPDEVPPAVIRDRLAFFLSDQVEMEPGEMAPHERQALDAARARLKLVDQPEEIVSLAVRTATELGCTGTRPALFVLRAARAIAALDGTDTVLPDQLGEAVRLVLAHRMRVVPENIQQEKQPEIENQTPSEADGDTKSIEDMLQDIVLEAARTALPDDLLATLIGRDRRGAGSGQGAERVSYSRGRPLPSRPGTLDGQSRLDLLATLHAAAPWQTLRDATRGQLAIRKSDLRVRRYQERSERMLVFLVDASGSAAMARLAEAKGAAETLLSEAYRSRDHVSLISFRGESADCVLEPTRSLVRAKRLLGGLPGGGATPLAAALMQGADQCRLARKKGLTPHVILMTDGRANKALDGSTDRVAAREDALKMAKQLRAMNVPVLVVDSGLRPSAELEEIARAMAARSIRLPRGHGRGTEGLMAALES